MKVLSVKGTQMHETGLFLKGQKVCRIRSLL